MIIASVPIAAHATPNEEHEQSNMPVETKGCHCTGNQNIPKIELHCMPNTMSQRMYPLVVCWQRYLLPRSHRHDLNLARPRHSHRGRRLARPNACMKRCPARRSFSPSLCNPRLGHSFAGDILLAHSRGFATALFLQLLVLRLQLLVLRLLLLVFRLHLVVLRLLLVVIPL